MVFGNPMLLICMRSQNRVILLYLSRSPSVPFSTMTGSTLWTFWRTGLPCKYGTLGPLMSSAILTYSSRIEIFCGIFLSTACKIRFTGWLLMCYISLVWSDLFTSQVVYCFLFYSTYGTGERELFTMMCALFLFLRRCLISC